MKKLMAIRTPSEEPTCRFCCIDDFDNFINIDSDIYYCGIQVYESFDKSVIHSNPQLRSSKGNNMGGLPIRRNRSDVFEKPDIMMYNTIGRVLMENGLVFNKKTGEIQKKKE